MRKKNLQFFKLPNSSLSLEFLEEFVHKCATRYFPNIALADEGLTVKILTTPTSPLEGA